MICTAILIQSTRVTYRQTDRIAVAYELYALRSILSRVKRKEKENWKSRVQKKSKLKNYKEYIKE